LSGPIKVRLKRLANALEIEARSMPLPKDLFRPVFSVVEGEVSVPHQRIQCREQEWAFTVAQRSFAPWLSF